MTSLQSVAGVLSAELRRDDTGWMHPGCEDVGDAYALYGYGTDVLPKLN